MIHAVYVRNRPKAKWHLVATTASPEAANHDLDQFKKQAKLEGHDEAEVAVQCFKSSFYIPQILDIVKDQKPQYN